ncbi:MAG TPA: GtrA family protein [Clostridia bacterium]|nr:GtrA family protein [Clostridia bacterium]
MSKFNEKVHCFAKKYPTLCEFVRFLIVGGLATIIDMFVMGVVLYFFNPSIYPNFFNVFFGGGRPTTVATIVSTGCGFICGLIFNYIFSVLFVFNEKGDSKTVKGAVIFWVLSTVGLGLHYLGMYLGFDLLKMNEWIVKIIMTVVVLIYNYLSKKFLLFRNKKKQACENLENNDTANNVTIENITIENGSVNIASGNSASEIKQAKMMAKNNEK